MAGVVGVAGVVRVVDGVGVVAVVVVGAVMEAGEAEETAPIMLPGATVHGHSRRWPSVRWLRHRPGV